ncbi:hypothetical protein EhV145_00176 [Emiliania huxleyi virus 145]|nr:hypothetical protein EhV145_00176 [Emiliania huxleyi virus 145]AHA55751.1 hypothetical protein EhV164_00161 [Emiliania huxleyi virus 164]
MSDTNVKPLSIIIKNRTKKMKLSDEYMAKMKILRDGVTGVYVASKQQKFRAITGKKKMDYILVNISHSQNPVSKQPSKLRMITAKNKTKKENVKKTEHQTKDGMRI